MTASAPNLPDATLLQIQQCIDRDAIRTQLSLYARAVDRCDADLLRTIFWPDGIDDHGSFRGGPEELIEWAFPQLRQLDQSHHHMANPAIALAGDRAQVETYFIAYHRVPPGAGLRDNVIGGRYIDTFERRDGEWRILLRRVGYDYSCAAAGVAWSDLGFSTEGTIGGKKPDDPLYHDPARAASEPASITATEARARVVRHED